MIIDIEIPEYNKNTREGFMVGLATKKILKDILFSVGKPFLEKKCKTFIKNGHKKIIIICGDVPVVEIKSKDIIIEKKGDGMRITVDIENLNLDELVDTLAETYFKDNQLVREVIKAANNSIKGDEKIKLIQQILIVINNNNTIDDVLKVLVKNNKGMKMIESLGLKIGDVTVE